MDVQAPVFLISHRFWQRRFNGNPNVLGQILRGGTEWDKTIIGVMPLELLPL